MPKARHRKRIRTARVNAAGQPLGAAVANGGAAAEDGASSVGAVHASPAAKKVGKKESEVTGLLDKLKSVNLDERVWASAALSSLILTLEPVTLKLLLSNNLIGILISCLTDPSPSVSIESLGALRNLAVSSPLSVVSEIHNKRVLLPLANSHIPALAALLDERLAPPAPKLVAPLPSTAEQRKVVDDANDLNEEKRRMYWDWAENVFTLLWCLAESNTKILASLNAIEGLGAFCLSFLAGGRLGIGEAEMGDTDMEGSLKKKGKRVESQQFERVPLFVAVAAAHTLHALCSSNPTFVATISAHPLVPSLAHILSTPSAPAFTKSEHNSTAETDLEDWNTLRVLSFGTLLELTSGAKGEGRQVLSENVNLILAGLGTDLQDIAREAIELSKGMDPNPPSGTLSPAALRITSFEKTLSTLQLSLEILGEWCAALDSDAGGRGSKDADDEEEEWGGIVEGGDDIEMDEDEDDGTPSNDEGGDMDDDSVADAVPLSNSTLSLFSTLPPLLLALAQPTPISFLPPATSAPTPTKSLIPTSSFDSLSAPSPLLAPLSELLTTLHVRALECLNNLFITIARSNSSSLSTAALQPIWSGVLSLVQSLVSTIPNGQLGNVLEEEEDQRISLVSAGLGAVWGMSRLGLGVRLSSTPPSNDYSIEDNDDSDEEEEAVVDVGESARFLVEVFGQEWTGRKTPSAEAIRVRIVGALGWIGRRRDVGDVENEAIGSFLLSLLPEAKNISPLSPTPEVLLQSIDSLIDLYSDEEASYDLPIFRSKGFLGRLERAVPGVRATAKKIDRKKFPELRSRADGALENLVGFVEYRKDVAR